MQQAFNVKLYKYTTNNILSIFSLIFSLSYHFLWHTLWTVFADAIIKIIPLVILHSNVGFFQISVIN